MVNNLRCCLTTHVPGEWTAGVDDSADPRMVEAMVNIRDRLSYRMPIEDFIWTLKASVNIDSRTMMGGDVQRCLLSNAAHRLQILAQHIDPSAHYRTPMRERLKDAWAVFRSRAVVIYTDGGRHAG